MIMGIGRALLLGQSNPTFVWDAVKARASGLGLEGEGNFKFTKTDEDAIPTTEPFCVWDSGGERFKVVTPSANPDDVFGSAGYFGDGYIQQRWSATWDAANLGFAVTTPTPAGSLYQDTGVQADIVSGATLGDITVVDTTVDLVNDAVIERSNVGSTGFTRVVQILVKSEAGTSPVGIVTLGTNTTAGTRTTSASTWCRKLPGSRGWWAVMLTAPLITPVYITLKITTNTGRWFLACPLFYNKWLTSENITRAPIPVTTGPTVYRRGLWYMTSTNAEVTLKPTGWLAMSVVLPDPSVSNGHLDYAGVGNYKIAYLLHLDCGLYRLRVTMSDTYDRLAVSMGTTAGVNFAFLDCPSDWQGYAAMGIVATWEINNGSKYAYLYVNGVKQDSVVDPADWYPQGLTPSTLWVGTVPGGGNSAADCYISTIAMGRKPLQRKDARVLSVHMRDIARGQIR